MSLSINREKDNVLTIPLSGSKLVFTRYLYIKDEVRIAILVSLLNKSNDALFWAFELFQSGFQIELLNLIWKIYYDFFATSNPSFENYLKKKKSIYLSDVSRREKIIASIINNLLIRDFNTDVFMLRNICESFEKDPDETDEIKCNAYRILSDKIPEVASEYLVSKLLIQKNTKTKGRNFYVQIESDSLLQYRTIDRDKMSAYNVLKTACKCEIDEAKMLSLFKLERTANIREKFSNNWIYHASFSPIWFDRIKEFKGYIDYVNNCVKFINDEWEEAFYNAFNYEPDEQSQIIKDRCVPVLEKRNTWFKFYDMFKNNGIVEVSEEELSEFDADLIRY